MRNFWHELVALDQLSGFQDIQTFHLKDRAYNKKPSHILQMKEELNVKFDYLNAARVLCAANQSLQDVKFTLNMIEDSLNNFLQLLIAPSAGGWL